MNKKYLSQLTAKEQLDIIGKAVDQLVRTADSCFNLSEKEKCYIVDGAFSGINKIIDSRYDRLKKRHSIKDI